jgi:sortase A
MMAAESRRHAAAALRATERVLLIVGIVALGWYAGARVSAARDQASWARELAQQTAARSLAPAAGAHRRVPKPRSLVAKLEVPRLGLSAIAREGVDERTLRSAVGHVPNTALPGERGNAAFAAHRDSYFRKLRHVRTGDRVVLTTPDGVFDYVVGETRVVEPNDISVLAPADESTVTLVTCYPFDFIGPAPKRFVVRGKRKEE